MTKEAIRQAALKRFAEQGYNATSMADIAGDVGIKAPAIYAHFKGKKELFFELVHLVLDQELSYTKQFFNGGEKTEDILLLFLQEIGPRFESTPHLRFMLNVYYLPPPVEMSRLSGILEEYNLKREVIINDVFKHFPPCRIPPEQLASAYLGIMDSIQAEFLYGGMEKGDKRLEALWSLLRLAFTR